MKPTKAILLVSMAMLYAGVAAYCFHVAQSPMTPEWYASACGNEPECYPELFYLAGGVCALLLPICIIFGWLVEAWIISLSNLIGVARRIRLR